MSNFGQDDRYKRVEFILNEGKGFVGIDGGLKAFLRRSANELKNGVLNGGYYYNSYSIPENARPENWVTWHTFKQIYDWKVGEVKLSVKVLQDLEFEALSETPKKQ